jgi:hypothetical protein
MNKGELYFAIYDRGIFLEMITQKIPVRNKKQTKLTVDGK